MEVNKLSKLIESVDEILGDDSEKDTLKAIVMDHLLNKKESTALLGLLKKVTSGEDSIITKNWRPVTVVIVGLLLVNNYLIYPYLHMLNVGAPYFVLSDDTSQALIGFLIAYAVGRSGEKAVTTFKAAKTRDE